MLPPRNGEPAFRRLAELECQRLMQTVDAKLKILDRLDELRRDGLAGGRALHRIEAALQGGDLTDHLSEARGFVEKTLAADRQGAQPLIEARQLRFPRGGAADHDRAGL